MTDDGNKFHKELEALINTYSLENESNTPDFILASFICNALTCFDSAVKWRDKWYGYSKEATGGSSTNPQDLGEDHEAIRVS